MCNTDTYYTMIRVNAGSTAAGRGDAVLRARLAHLPPSMAIATNFGLVDVTPSVSGKRNVAVYAARKLADCDLSDCAGIGDDDNDIAMLSAMGKRGFVTGFSSQSIEQATVLQPQQFVVAKQTGVLAAEEMLEAILAISSVMSD
jgi:hydroxymethylpyrimidine pyrophosphatase-like HAD family hydrolase